MVVDVPKVLPSSACGAASGRRDPWTDTHHALLLLPRQWRCSTFGRHVLSMELADGTAGQLCNAGAGEVELSGQCRRRRYGWYIQTADADAAPTPLTMMQPQIDDIAVRDRGHQLKYG